MLETENQLIERLDKEINGGKLKDSKPEPKEEPVKKQEISSKPEIKVNLGTYLMPLKTGKTGAENEEPWLISRFTPKTVYISERHKNGHPGLDLGAPEGTNVYSPGPGTVTKVGSGDVPGNYVKIKFEPDDRLTCFMGHLGQIFVHEGQKVNQTTVVGLNSTTGSARGTHPHCHFELNLDGKEVDPLTIIGKPVGSFKSNSNDNISQPKTAAESLSLQFLKILDNDLLF